MCVHSFYMTSLWCLNIMCLPVCVCACACVCVCVLANVCVCAGTSVAHVSFDRLVVKTHII